MEENQEIRNQDVPIETVFRWKQVECWKLRNKVAKLEATVRQLQNNIRILIKDKEIKKEIAKESYLRDKAREVNRLNKKLHNAYESIQELILTKLNLEAKLRKYEQDSSSD